MAMENNVAMREYLNARVGELDADFELQRPVLRDIQEYISPYTGQGLSGNTRDEKKDGKRKDGKIYDPTATYAMNTLAAGLMSGLTSPALPWFKLRFPDQDLNEYGPVKEWLYIVEQRMQTLFSQSNFYQAIHSAYHEIGNYATAAMGIFFDFDKGIRCRPFTCGEYRFSLNDSLVVDTFVHSQWLSARQIVGWWGEENVSQPVKTAYQNKQAESLFEVCWIVEPNDDRFESKDFMQRPYRSVYWEKASTENKVLEVSGFWTFPIMVPRWNIVGGRAWGTGCGHDVIGHTKQLQKLQERSLVIIDKQTDPPLVGPASLANGTAVNTMPGGITAMDEMSNTPGLRTLHDVRADMPSLQNQIVDIREQIREGCYNHLFRMIAALPDQTQRTATEWVKREEENLTQIGPVIGRLHTELLDAAIDRTFGIMAEQTGPDGFGGMIPPPPEEIQGMTLSVEYTSLLAQAQKMIGTKPVEQMMAFTGNMLATFPQVAYKVDPFDVIDKYADMVGAPPTNIIDSEVAAENMRIDQEVAAQKERAEQMQQIGSGAAQAAKLLSETELGKNSALDSIAQGMGQ